MRGVKDSSGRENKEAKHEKGCLLVLRIFGWHSVGQGAANALSAFSLDYRESRESRSIIRKFRSIVRGEHGAQTSADLARAIILQYMHVSAVVGCPHKRQGCRTVRSVSCIDGAVEV